MSYTFTYPTYLLTEQSLSLTKSILTSLRIHLVGWILGMMKKKERENEEEKKFIEVFGWVNGIKSVKIVILGPHLLPPNFSQLFYMTNYDWLHIIFIRTHYFFFITHNIPRQVLTMLWHKRIKSYILFSLVKMHMFTNFLFFFFFDSVFTSFPHPKQRKSRFRHI